MPELQPRFWTGAPPLHKRAGGQRFGGVRRDPVIGEQVLAFLKTYAPRSAVVTDRIIGCPHESVYVLVAIVRKRLRLESSFYQILQILSLTR
jgi:hypothetical protein